MTQITQEVEERLAQFLLENYKQEIIDAILENKKYIEIDYNKLEIFDVELADMLLEEPEATLEAMQKTIENLEYSEGKRLRIRLKNLPPKLKIRIRNLRSEHLGKLIMVDGIVKRASEIRPEVSEIVYECNSCGSTITILQKERTITKPDRCEVCGARKGFTVLDQKVHDARWIVIEEPYEIISGERPSEIMVYLKEDLTTPKMQNITDPGNRIMITGILKQSFRKLRGSKAKQMEIYIDANNVEPLETMWEEVEITKEDEEKIKEFAKREDLFEQLINSIAPSMYGLDYIKEAIILQMFGGVPKILPDKTRVRGNIHILIVGDPASGKSQLLQLVTKIMPRAKYVSGTGVTAAGITATVTRDEEFLGGWVLEAGALVMANDSICAIDEFSKVPASDRVALQEAMSVETISIAKASIVATLPARTAVLAGSNPKLGRFDPYIPIREQIDVDDVLLSRFDLKFALRDVPDPERDKQIAEYVLKLRAGIEEIKPAVDVEFLRKYIAYARSHVFPKLSKEAGERLKEFYLEMRSMSGEEAPIAITLRQYESLIRLAEASARVRLSDTVDIEDAERAIKLMKISLRQFGFEPETGMYDIDRAEGQRITAAQRSKIRRMREIIEELEARVGKEIPEDELIEVAKKEGIDNAEDIIRKMVQEGLLFRPKPGYIQRTGG